MSYGKAGGSAKSTSYHIATKFGRNAAVSQPRQARTNKLRSAGFCSAECKRQAGLPSLQRRSLAAFFASILPGALLASAGPFARR